MNLIIKTEIGNITIANVTKVQELNDKLNITSLKSKGGPSKSDLSFMRKALDYVKIKSSVREFALSIEYEIDVNPNMKIELELK